MGCDLSNLCNVIIISVNRFPHLPVLTRLLDKIKIVTYKKGGFSAFFVFPPILISNYAPLVPGRIADPPGPWKDSRPPWSLEG